jgi:hypothetical protein
MSACRNRPPPPPRRVIFRTPLLQRVGRGAVLGGIGILALLSILGIASALLGVRDSNVAAMLAAFSFLVGLTVGALFLIDWGTHVAQLAERTISAVSSDPTDPARCFALCDGERWSLPLRQENLRVGQTIQVRYRDVAPDSNAASGREILEIKLVED